MPTKEEQETTVTWSPADSFVYIYTNVPKHIAKLRSDNRVTNLKQATLEFDDEDWGKFMVNRGVYDPLTGFKRTRKGMTDEQKAAGARRLAEARSRKGSSNGEE